MGSGYRYRTVFDKVNHDKLIQILREQVNDSTTLNLIRKYLKAGVMENGLEKATITGVPQGVLFQSYVQMSTWTSWTKNWNIEDSALQGMQMMY